MRGVKYGCVRMSMSEDFERMRELRKRTADYKRAAADPTLPTSCERATF
jgi:hypothetical protein